MNICCDLYPYCSARGPLGDARRILDGFLALTADGSVARARCLSAAAVLAVMQSDFAVAVPMADESLRIGHETHNAELVAFGSGAVLFAAYYFSQSPVRSVVPTGRPRACRITGARRRGRQPRPGRPPRCRPPRRDSGLDGVRLRRPCSRRALAGIRTAPPGVDHGPSAVSSPGASRRLRAVRLEPARRHRLRESLPERRDHARWRGDRPTSWSRRQLHRVPRRLPPQRASLRAPC